MESFNAITKDNLHDWVEAETRPIDIVASWETLCDIYKTLEFTDPINDAVRMEEFKWIIGEMNKHLSRSRKKLMTCQNRDSMKEILAKMFTSTDAKVTNRMDLTYHKLRQIWVKRMIQTLDMMEEETEKETEDGSGSY